MTSLFHNFLSPRNLRSSINNLSYLPRWIIIAIDVMVLIFSFTFTYMLFEGTALGYIITSHQFYFVSSLIVVNVFFFWLFRTYSGIIRHSSYIDAIKLLFSQMSVLVFFLFFNLVFELYTGHKAFLNTALFINLVLSFCGLFLYRVVVKQTFELYFSEKTNSKLIRTVIYGTDANAISVANALKFETPDRKSVV